MFLSKPFLYACLLGIWAAFAACTNQSTLEKDRYFDIKGFVEQEVDRLDSLQPKVKKTASLNGKKEVKTIKAINWKQELQSLKDLDINKPAWFDGYSIDTLHNSLTIITYEAKSNNLPVRKIRLSFNEQDQLVSLEAKRMDHNFIYSSEQTYTYNRNKTYEITGQQDILLIGGNHFTIKGTFIHN